MKLYVWITILSGLLLFPFRGRAEAAPDWVCNAFDYQYDMSVYLTLKLNSASVNENKVVGAFCRDICRGVAELHTVGNTTYFYLRVRSNRESGDTITLQVYDKQAAKVTAVSEKLVFKNLMQVGLPSQPWTVVLPNRIEIGTPGSMDQISAETEEIQLSGELTPDVVAELKDKIQGGGGEGSQLSSVDLSNTTVSGGTSLGGLFSGCNLLTSVTLPNLSSLKKEQNPVNGSNPNCLVFVPEGTTVEDELRNEANIVQNGQIEQLNLKAGSPFNTPVTLMAKEVTYQLSPATKSLKSASLSGWSTLCLPFTVANFKADGKLIRPTTYQQDADFYLATLTRKGFELTNVLEGNKPYLIRMINPAGVSVDGPVELSATNVTISVSGQEYVSEGTTFDFVGVMGGVEQADAVYALNAAGNTFVRRGGNVPPLGAYIRSKSSALGEEVRAILYVPVKGVTLDLETLSLKEGESKELSATVSPEDATDKTVTWSVKDNSIATVSITGKVVAVKAGTTTITVRTNEGDFSASCTVTVVKPDPDPSDPEPPAVVKVTGVALSPSSYTLNIGATATLLATVRPANATNKKVSWKSSDVSVVTVDVAGKVTAHQPGDVIVTVTTDDGNFKAECLIKVTLPTGLEGINEKQLQVIPTFVSDYMTVTGLEKVAKIWVISINGAVVKEMDVTSPSAAIQLQGLATGFYIVKVVQEKELHTFKIFKK